MFKKLFWTGLMAVCGIADIALGVFALNEAGSWIVEDVGHLKEKAKHYIHEKTGGEETNEDQNAEG